MTRPARVSASCAPAQGTHLDPCAADGVQIGLELADPQELNAEGFLVLVDDPFEPRDLLLQRKDAGAVARGRRRAGVPAAGTFHRAASLALIAPRPPGDSC
jgi:hypothetical protein